MFDEMWFINRVNDSGIFPFYIFDYYWGLILLVLIYGRILARVYIVYGRWSNISKSWAESKVLGIGIRVLILVFFSISSSRSSSDLYEVPAFNNLRIQTCSCGCEVQVVRCENCSQYLLFFGCLDFLFFVDACGSLDLKEVDLIELMQIGLEDLKYCFHFFYIKSSFLGLSYERLICVFFCATDTVRVSIEPLFMSNWRKVLFFFDRFFRSLFWFVPSVSLFDFNCVYRDFGGADIDQDIDQKFGWGSFCFHKNLFSTSGIDFEPQTNKLPVHLHRIVKILFEKYKFRDIYFSDQELIDVKQGLVALYRVYVWVFVVYYLFFR